jgi:hypothetical protein
MKVKVVNKWTVFKQLFSSTSERSFVSGNELPRLHGQLTDPKGFSRSVLRFSTH